MGVTPVVAMETSLADVSITSHVESILACGTSIMNYIIANPLLLTLFCGTFVSLGCYVIRKVKRVAKA